MLIKQYIEFVAFFNSTECITIDMYQINQNFNVPSCGHFLNLVNSVRNNIVALKG